MNKRFLFCLFSVLFLCHVQAFSKTIQTSYIHFSVPDSWTCTQDSPVWICKGSQSLGRRLVLSMAARRTRPSDNIDSLIRFLRKPKEFINSNREIKYSEVKRVRILVVDKRKWAEALHFESEASNYYTHYLSTFSDGRMILLTYSFHKSSSDEATQAYNKIIDSMVFLVSSGGRDFPSEMISEEESVNTEEGFWLNKVLIYKEVAGNNLPYILLGLAVLFFLSAVAILRKL